MNGQLNIFDVDDTIPAVRRYRFNRSLGQKVKLASGQTGKIIEIQPYYTIIEYRGEKFVGTPTTTSPVEETEE